MKRVGLEAYGLEIVENVPMEIQANEHNYRYLLTKQERMHHALHLNKQADGRSCSRLARQRGWKSREEKLQLSSNYLGKVLKYLGDFIQTLRENLLISSPPFSFLCNVLAHVGA